MKATKLNEFVVTSFDLSDELHDIAVSMIKDNVRTQGNYTLNSADIAMVDVWADNASNDENLGYADFLKEAIANGDELLTLTDNLDCYTQELGEVIVSKC